MSSYHIVIPARYASTRFPGKPLAEINGKSMLEHVFSVASQSSARTIVIATDDAQIHEHARGFCGNVLMTSDQHQSGTDRLAEVCEQMHWDNDDIVVNLQGDEPLTPVSLLNQVSANLHQNKDAAIATLTTPLAHESEINDPNIVKVVSDIHGYALYFSRAAIPYHRDNDIADLLSTYHRHLGIYAYRVSFLNAYNKMPQCQLEVIEKLEQLRAMYHGYKIHTEQATSLPGPGIDTPEDLLKVQSLLVS